MDLCSGAIDTAHALTAGAISAAARGILQDENCILRACVVDCAGGEPASRGAQRSRANQNPGPGERMEPGRDSKAVAPLLDEELIYIDDDGVVMNKARYLANLREPEPRLLHIVNESTQVRFFVRCAVVIVIYREQ